MTLIDQFLTAADEGLKALTGAVSAARPSPCREGAGPSTPEEKRRSAGLMRVNHTGEICAQALYSGQALVARDPEVRHALQRAASEERDHLAWCRDRLEDLDARPSLLNPLWYAGSFGLGLASGLAGDRWSMGFLAETEDQVERHLDGHLDTLPAADACSREIVTQMRDDEARHGATAEAAGAADLPRPVKGLMQLAAAVMKAVAYRV